MASIKTGDSGVPLQGVLTDSDGNPADLEGAEVRVLMRRRGDNFQIAADAENLQVGDGEDGTKGRVAYTWAEEDTVTDNAGLYFVEWEVTFQEGEVQTFPSNGWNKVAIVRDNDEEGS